MTHEFVNQRARREIFDLQAYVPGKPIEEVKRELGLDDVIKLASNENPLGASPLGRAAVIAGVNRLHLYPDSYCYELKAALAEFWRVTSAQLLVANGSDEVLRLIAETFLNPGDEVIIGEPTFSEYRFVATIMGAKTVTVPLRDYRYDLTAMAAAISPATKILIICNPNNPTGAMVSRTEIEIFLDSVSEEVLVVFDEAYSEYVSDPAFVSGLDYIEKKPNLMVLHTFSKIYGLAGLRVGYGIAHQDLIAAINRVKDPFNVNIIAQAAAQAALADSDHIKCSRELNERGKAFLYHNLSALGLSYVPTESNFILVDTGRDGLQVFQELMRMGIIIRPAHSFGYPSHIRVTIGTEAENIRFIEGLKQVLAQRV